MLRIFDKIPAGTLFGGLNYERKMVVVIGFGSGGSMYGSHRPGKPTGPSDSLGPDGDTGTYQAIRGAGADL
jgi:hypothetical protein